MFNYLSMFLSKALIAQTGDESNITLWFIILGVAAALMIGGLVFILVIRKKASKAGDDEAAASDIKNKND